MIDGSPATMLDEPFLGSEALALGLLSRAQLYGTRFQRVFPGVYLPAGSGLDLATRSRAAYLFVRERGGVLTGYSAALMLGADCAPRTAPAEVLVSRHTQRQPMLRVRYGTPGPGDVVEVEGLRVTGPGRTAWDLSRRLSLTEAVVAVDSLGRATAFIPRDLLERRRESPGARNCRRLDEVVALADPRAESPGESRLRVGLVRAGLPRPEVQYRISDEHGFVLARADLAYPHVRMAIEYDGSAHFSVRAGKRDRHRDAVLAGYGWLTMRMTDDDVWALPQTVQRVARQLRIRPAGPLPAPSSR
jgi:hypothetical protein